MSGSRSVHPDTAREAHLLNARGRLCRVHTRSTALRTWNGSAQRPGASLSGSRQVRPMGRPVRRCSTPGGVFVGFTTRPASGRAAQRICSTPGGVFVGFTRSAGSNRRVPSSAQRPGASLSGSPMRGPIVVRRVRLLNARGRLCRVHGVEPAGDPVGFACSTPGGVFVGFTPARTDQKGPNPAAQRPGASLSGSRQPNRRANSDVGCSTPGGVFVGFTPGSCCNSSKIPNCSTPGGVFVGFTRRDGQRFPR